MFDLNREAKELQSDKDIAWQIYKKSTTDVIGLYTLVLCICVIFILPLCVNFDPLTQNVAERLLPPSWSDRGNLHHFLGTDEFGRDFLSRLMIGAQNTTKYAFLACTVSMIVGTCFGLSSAMSRRRAQKSVLHHIFDILFSIPSILIALITIGILGPSLPHAALAIGISLLPRFIHESYHAAQTELEKEYVRTEIAEGSSRMHLSLTTILPNIMSTIISNMSQGLSIAIMDIAAVGYLGFGAQPPTPELGNMMASGIDIIYISTSKAIIPGVAMIVLISSIQLVGHGICRVLNTGVSDAA